MIVRLWRGRARRERADAYQAYVVTAVFPKLVAIDGYVGGRVLRRDTGTDVEFLVVTEWASWDAIRAFAGGRPEVAVIEPDARAMLTDVDEHVRHFAVAHESRRA
ncbi:MAG: antibiotic biosynthesis monooxygenase [Luteitalea sp.]|nr:antibiotic biosynthesis monooxygenase [Luteitalea sp.]